MPDKIEAIVFDLGGVLIDWNPEYVFREIFEEEKEMRYFFENICTPEWNEQQDAGRSLAAATEALVRQYPGYEAPIRAYYGRWEEMLGGPIEATVRLLEELHSQGRQRILALTNWSHETFPVALERYAFLQLFEGIVVSGKEQLIKPDLRIYQLLLKRYRIDAPTALFIDDNPKNVMGARRAGMQAIHFQTPAALEEKLRERTLIG